MKEIFIISNDKFYVKKKDFFNSNKNTFTIINCFKKLKKIYLFARTSKNKGLFRRKMSNTELIGVNRIFEFKERIRKQKTLIISLTPYNFFIAYIFTLIGVRKKNLFLFLRSDGYQEYTIKYGKLGGLIYNMMLGFIKNKLNIITCSTSINKKIKSRLVYLSEISNKWLHYRKKNIKKINFTNKIRLLYLGRFRKEKGFQDLINLFNNLRIDCSLTIVGNDFKFLKKKNYPKNPNIKIFGQVSSEKKLIKFYDNSDIFILPSYTEAYPQVILESFSRLRPVIIFKEIIFLKNIFKKGLFWCYRNPSSLRKTIKKIINEYEKIQIQIYKDKLYTFNDFKTQLINILIKKK